MSLQDYLIVQDKRQTQYPLRMEDVPNFLIIPKSECPDFWIRLPRHKWPKSRSNTKIQWVPLKRNLHGHPLAGLLWERQFEEVLLLELGWVKAPTWECLLVNRKTRIILIGVRTTFKNDWKKAEFESHVEEIDEAGRSWRTNILS